MVEKLKKYFGRFYVLIIVLFLYAPTFTLMVLSFNNTKSRSIWAGFTTKWYVELFQNASIMQALYNTLLIAFLSATVATILGTLAAMAIENMKHLPKKLMMNVTYLPIVSPEIVTGISLMLLYIIGHVKFGFLTILLGHITFNIPYVVINVIPKLKQLNPNLYEAAVDLGAKPSTAFFKVILPEIMPGILTGFLLSFTFSLDDFVITHFVKGAGIDTLSTKIYAEVRKGIKPEMYALATILFFAIVIILLLINRSKKEKKFRSRRSMKFRLCAAGVATVLIIGSFIVMKPDTTNVLYVYNWGEYMEPQVLEEFEKETGIHVIYDEFTTNEDMLPKVKSGAIPYDVVFPSDYMVQRMIQEDMLEEIDLSKIPNVSNIDPVLMNREYDPENKYSLPYMWGTVGILYNKKMVKDVVDSWDILWDPKYKNEILMQDSVRDAFCVALKKLHYSVNTTNVKELEEAKQLLIEQKPLVQAYVIDQVRDKMIGNEASLAVIYSGEATIVKESNPDVEYVVPKEGSNLWIDAVVIPKTTQNKEGAEKFINFLCRSDIGMQNTEYIGYSSPLIGTKELLPESWREDPVLYPPEEVLKKCEVYTYLDPKVDAIYNEKWREVRGASAK